jgi:hypothetical protein
MNSSFIFYPFLTFNYGEEEGKAAAAAAAMVFCVSCGNKLAGRYCRQCGAEDSQSTANAQSQVPVLTVTIPAEGAAKKHGKGKGRRSKDCKSAARDASKSKGSAAGGIGAAQASGQVLDSLPAAVASRASPRHSGGAGCKVLNPDGGRLKLGSLASTRCTGLVAKHAVGPLLP